VKDRGHESEDGTHCLEQKTRPGPIRDRARMRGGVQDSDRVQNRLNNSEIEKPVISASLKWERRRVLSSPKLNEDVEGRGSEGRQTQALELRGFKRSDERGGHVVQG